jgi:hypothetical protein
VADENERIRIEIAFEGGQTIGALVPGRAADGLQEALAGARDGVFELEADDGAYVIPLHAVVYVKRFSRETQIGFGRTA